MKNVFQTVRDTDFFQLLLSAVEAVGLSDTLSGPGPFTLFAPVDGAFEKLVSEKREKIFQNKWKLRQILTSHVMADKVTTADIENMGLVKMMNDNIFSIVVSHDGIMIDGAKIIQGDILCSNGVIHAIDGLIQAG
jgi:uncharacterized surface protein with fasciclin (FAS1) repeats